MMKPNHPYVLLSPVQAGRTMALMAMLLTFLPLRGLSQAANVLDWQSCVKEAAKNNPELVSAWEQIRQAEADKKITDSGRMPSVSASADAGRSKSSSSDASDSYSYDGSASQLLFDGGKSRNQAAAAEEQIAVSRFSYQATSAGVRLSLRNAFIALLRAQSLIDTTQGILKRREQSTRLIKLRYEAGREHKGSLLTAEAKFEQAKAEAAQAERGLLLAQRELATCIGWTNPIPVTVIGTVEPANVEKQQPDFARLAETSPALKEYEARTRAAGIGIKSARADFLPVADASASVGRNSSDWPPKDDSWNVGVSVKLPIFEGGRSVAAVRKAVSAHNAARSDETSERNTLVTALVSAWIELQNAIDNAAVKAKFLEATRERAKIAEAQYSTGLLNFDNWIIIEDEFDMAEKNLLDTRAQALKAEANWIYAKGGTLENEVN